jgi:hypothetical protein
MIPLYCRTTDFCEPRDPLYYLLAANGIFLVKNTSLFSSVTTARTVAGLEDQTEALQLRFPPVPRGAMELIWGFFREVYERWEAEAVVFLYYVPELKKYRLGVPAQRIFRYKRGGIWRTEGRVVYDNMARPNGHILLGDVHSHCDLPAFFSYTDDADDKADGLRIILGRVDRSQPDVKASFVASGRRFKVETERACERFGVPQVPPRGWLKQITCLYEQEDYERGRWGGRHDREYQRHNGRTN